jgi:hypothetical protein
VKRPFNRYYDRKLGQYTQLERKIQRFIHDPVRFETGRADDKLLDATVRSIKAVKLG